jgi:carboxyl-terminal processing protease
VRVPLIGLALAVSLSSLAAARPLAEGALQRGVWESRSFGYVAQADRRRVRTYDISSAGCVRGPSYTLAAFRDTYGAFHSDTTDRATLARGPTRDFLTSLPALPTACRRPLRSQNPRTNYAVFVETFRELYPFFDARGVSWNEATARFAPNSSEELFDAMSQLAASLNDGHVSIQAGEQSFDPNAVIAPGTAPDGSVWAWRTLRTSLRDYLQSSETPLTTPMQFAGNRRVLHGRIGDIGYIAVLAMGGWAEDQTEDTPVAQHAEVAADVLDQVLSELGDVRGMVIDLRANSGGFDTVSFEIASRFADVQRLAFTRQARADTSPRYDVILEPSERQRFTGPVAVLLGPNTVSAGESAALAFAALPHARLFGQPTRGVLSDAIPKTLPNGWTFTLSVEMLRTPEGEIVEARGVKPDVIVAAPASADPSALWALDPALVWLRASNENGRRS